MKIREAYKEMIENSKPVTQEQYNEIVIRREKNGAPPPNFKVGDIVIYGLLKTSENNYTLTAINQDEFDDYEVIDFNSHHTLHRIKKLNNQE